MDADAKKIAELEKLVADVDRGGRKATGLVSVILAAGALLWSFFSTMVCLTTSI